MPKKVWITRDWGDKTYEIWEEKPTNWDGDIYQGTFNPKIFKTTIEQKEAKKMFNLPRHLKKREVVEGTITFKVKVK